MKVLLIAVILAAGCDGPTEPPPPAEPQDSVLSCGRIACDSIPYQGHPDSLPPIPSPAHGNSSTSEP